MSTTRSELSSSGPSSGDPNDEGDGTDNSVWTLGTANCPYELDRTEVSTVGSDTDSGDGNDCTDEMVSWEDFPPFGPSVWKPTCTTGPIGCI